MKNYKEIKFSLGITIDCAIKELQACNELVCGSFNGTMLYSDIDTIDSAYYKILCQSKEEHEMVLKAEHDRHLELKQKHEDSIPELIKHFVDKGVQILDKKYHQKWFQCVPIRLYDLYEGMELQMCLDIVSALNNGCSLDDAKTILQSQEHSGMSFRLLCQMVESFCDRGLEFSNHLK